jgi:hypothetical protein
MLPWWEQVNPLITPGGNLRSGAIDREARETISREMGHGREQVTAVYLGR